MSIIWEPITWLDPMISLLVNYLVSDTSNPGQGLGAQLRSVSSHSALDISSLVLGCAIALAAQITAVLSELYLGVVVYSGSS